MKCSCGVREKTDTALEAASEMLEALKEIKEAADLRMDLGPGSPSSPKQKGGRNEN